jgi:hypothetical protein
MKKLFTYALLTFLSFQGIVMASTDAVSAVNNSLENLGGPTWDAKIYPNPNNGIFNVMITGTNASLDVRVYNVLGEKVYELAILGDHGAKIDLSGLQKGLYVVQIINQKSSEVVTRRMNLE